MSLKERVFSHSRQFFGTSSIHGIRGISCSPSILQKCLWALVVSTCTVFFSYQSYQLASIYVSEKTITEVGWLQGQYQTPRVIIGVPTFLLLQSHRQDQKSRLPELDTDVLNVAKYLTRVSNGDDRQNEETALNISHAVKKFNEYMRKKNVTWAEALQPYIFDLGPWLMYRQGGSGNAPLKVSRRLVWYPSTYHVIEPVPDGHSRLPVHNALQQSFDILLDWARFPLQRDDRHDTAFITVIGYEMLNDNFLLEEGGKYKLTFDITANAQLNLHRRPCVKSGQYHIHGYDEMACKEKCLVENIMHRFPSLCVAMPNVRYSLMDLYPRGRPCVPGTLHSSVNGNGTTQAEVTPLFDLWSSMSTDIKREILYKTDQCERSGCMKRCNELTVSYQLNIGSLMEDQPDNITILALEWPSPDGVTVYEEKYFFTIDSVVGEWGGLAGLWLGASVISFFEVLYFCACCFIDIGRAIEQSTRI